MSPAPHLSLAGFGAFFLPATLSLRGGSTEGLPHDITPFPGTLDGRADQHRPFDLRPDGKSGALFLSAMLGRVKARKAPMRCIISP